MPKAIPYPASYTEATSVVHWASERLKATSCEMVAEPAVVISVVGAGVGAVVGAVAVVGDGVDWTAEEEVVV